MALLVLGRHFRRPLFPKKNCPQFCQGLTRSTAEPEPSGNKSIPDAKPVAAAHQSPRQTPPETPVESSRAWREIKSGAQRRDFGSGPSQRSPITTIESLPQSPRHHAVIELTRRPPEREENRTQPSEVENQQRFAVDQPSLLAPFTLWWQSGQLDY